MYRALIWSNLMMSAFILGMDHYDALPEDYTTTLADLFRRTAQQGFTGAVSEIRALASQSSMWADCLGDSVCAEKIIVYCTQRYFTYPRRQGQELCALVLNTPGALSWCKRYAKNNDLALQHLNEVLIDACCYAITNIDFITRILDLGVLPPQLEVLPMAVLHGKFDVAKVLIEKGVDIESKSNTSQQTALMRSAMSNNTDMIVFLLERNAKVDAADRLGRTALYLAVEWCRYDAVSTLLHAGAAVHAKDKFGKTILSAGQRTTQGTEERRKQIIDVLKQYGAQE